MTTSAVERIVRPVDRVVRRIASALAVLAALAIVVLMLAICADVAVRTATGASLPGMVELAESSLVVAVYLAIAWGLVRGEHVVVTLLTDRLGHRANHVLAIIAGVAVVVLLAWATVATAERAAEATRVGEERFGLVRWPLWPLRWAIVVGFGVTLVVALVQLVDAVRGRLPHREGVQHDA
ncbi:TRAP transporter small permease [Agrococcus jejuensis]|uniref:TRAP-type C4-dicarboxylate transport system, small permease component n=1 Tax=Agrococcus jejuensis TaxID=399736 RepID=A0A1G8FXX7_9MICO|nr:TRAP transporter small permease [Agrococcus jejuensis]SDH86836.1 TRAP-type C4-dicarboxylate transport system, small permease component [Agrococcus jejuensis]